MAINKNFVIKNGVQVSTDLIIGDADTNRVGVGTTVPGYDLHVGVARGSRGGIGVTDAVVSGVATIGQLAVTGISTFTGALDVNSTVDFAADVVFNGTNDITYDQSESAFVFNDGAAIRVGTSSDFSIMHDGSNTILRDGGTGDLKLYGSRIEIGGNSVDETIAFFTENAGAQLYFNNEEKFQTVAIGATVFGDFIVSGVTTSARLKVTGISTFNGDVDINANVDVSGNTVLNGNVDLGDATSDTITATGRFDSDLVPSTDGARDLGTTSLEWEDLHLDGTAHIDTLDVDETAFVTTKLTVGTGVTVQSHGVVAIAGITTVGGNLLAGGDILPDDDGARDLGSSSKEFQDLFIDGTANIDSLAADTAAIGDLTDNRVVIAGTSGELEDDANFTFDGSKLNVGSGVATVFVTTGNVAFAGIATVGGALLVGAGVTVGGDILPDADGSRDLGSSTLEFQDLFIDGTANIDSLSADTALIGDLTDNRVVIAGSSGELEDDSNLTFDGVKLNVGSGVTIFPHGGAAFAGIVTVGGDLNVQGDIVYDEITGRNLNITGITTLQGQANFGGTLGIAATVFANGNVAISGITTVGGALLVGAGVTVGGDILPDADGSRDLGSATLEFQDLFIDGTANIDALVADTADINGGTVDAANIGASTPGTGAFTTLSATTSATVGTGVTLQGHGGVSIAGISTLNGNVNVGGGGDVTLTASIGAGSSTVSFDSSAGTLTLQDNIRLNIGNSSDLSIYHNGIDSYIQEQGTGNLKLVTPASGVITIEEADANIAVFTADSGVKLYDGANNIRLQTTTDGVDISGTGSIKVPVGTTGERNGSPAAGDFRYNSTLGKFEGYTDEWGEIGGGSVEETDTSVSTTSATSCGSFAIASFRSASIIAQITQGSNYQVGRYLVIHDGTTVTTIEESAVATGSMLGTFEGVINSSNLEFRVTMGSSSSATVTTKIDTVTV